MFFPFFHRVLHRVRMPLEIEHRFLVCPRKLPRPLPPGRRIEQGFLSLDPVVRVRVTTPPRGKPQAWLTVKGHGLRVREEFEYAVPVAEARRLLKHCGHRRILKTRMNLGRWECDRYHGRHRGLWTAEIELPSPRARLPKHLPEWLGPEVTHDPRFTNARLAEAGRWPKNLRQTTHGNP